MQEVTDEKLKSKIISNNNTGLIIYFNPKHDYVFSNLNTVRIFNWYNFGLFKEVCKIYKIN